MTVKPPPVPAPRPQGHARPCAPPSTTEGVESVGKVYLMGAGPGDPELLTLKAARILAEADCVLYDRLVHPAVLDHCRPGARRVYVGKEHGEQERAQQRIFELLLDCARRYRTVVRLKGGDPLVFGRGAEEWAFLRGHGVEVELVPGVTSAVAVPGVAGIPLTFRGGSASFAVVTGRCRPGREQDWRRLGGVDTLVVLMGVSDRDAIARSLIAAGRSPEEPVAFVERGTTPQQRIVRSTLGQVADGSVAVNPPAVFVIGPGVRLQPHLLPQAGHGAGDRCGPRPRAPAHAPSPVG